MLSASLNKTFPSFLPSPGDVILEINGKPTFSLQDVGKLQKLSHLSLLTIPIGRASNMIQVKKSLPKSAPAVPRIQRARELHDKVILVFVSVFRQGF